MAAQDSAAQGIAHQIPRNSLALLMVAQLVVILPLATHISPWIAAVVFLCGYWRTQVHRGRWGYPAGWIKTLLVVASVAGILASGYRTFSLEAATSLLVLAFALKLIEMKNRRDAYLVIYLSYFLIATEFLFDQSISITAYEVVAAVVVTAAMVGMNQLQSRVRPLASLKTAGGLILQAVPLMLVMFLLFPRIAPLWSIPIPSSASTGLSDRLTPGDVASLSQSDDVAFRAVFEDDVPLQRDLYWRGLVYSNFFRGTWSIAEPLPAIELAGASATGLDYQIFLEPTQSKWVFALDTPIMFSDHLQLLGDYRLVADEAVLSVMRYNVTSDTQYRQDPVLDPAVRYRETLFDKSDNRRLQEYAADLYRRAGDAQTMVAAMLEQIRSQDYVYTLQPPTLSKMNSIDEFWFDHRRGFCTHFAGAVVFALRSVGVPARVVGGYQGGEVNPVTGHVVVRQYQAHAWIEVWNDGDGWQRYDPTAAVAPARVEQGLNAALSSADRATLSFLASARMGDGNAMTSLLQFVDSLEHRWNLWVVGYDAAAQSDVLRDLLGRVTPARIGLAILIGGVTSVALVTIALFWRRRPQARHRGERRLQKFCAAMARQGWQRQLEETPAAYLRRLARHAGIDAEPLVTRIQKQLYDPAAETSRREGLEISQELRKLRFRLAFSSPDDAS